MEQKIYTKPISVNECWMGRRFKTKKYEMYERELFIKLDNSILEVEPPYCFQIVLGLSNITSDIDNPLKPFIDILQKKYNFNDRHIYELLIKKTIVPKGAEFINFKITHIELK